MAQSKADSPLGKITPVTDQTLLNPPDSDWLMWRRTYDGFGYSPLQEINKDNVKDLRAVWSWSMPAGRTELTPLVHDGVMFIITAGNRIQALDAAKGDLLWEYKHDLPADLVRAGGNQSMRAMAIYQDKLIAATTDAFLLSLDMKTGKVAWKYQVGDWSKGWRYTSGPMVIKDKILVGMTGCGNGQPGGCFISGHDAKTGKEAWRFYTIARPGEPGGDTWNGLPLESRFGGSAWIAGAYDPELNLTYWGVGQPYPWIAEMSGLLPQKPGMSNTALYTDSTLALDPDTGKLKWFRQHLENDTIDLDHVYERVLLDLTINGEKRKAAITVGKIGIIEAIDRTNGQWLWHKETVPQNVVTAIDPKTGAKTINPAVIPQIGKTTVNCPADPGGRGWPATAYSPRTGALYLPLAEFCSNTTPQPLDPGIIYTGGGRATFARVQVPNSDGKIGRVDAVAMSDQKTLWSFRQRAPITSAVLPTAGGLLFAGTLDRYFRAHDDTTGEILWESRASNAVNSYPISYAVNGKQYVAVVATNDSGITRSWGSLTPEILLPADLGVTLWVYALPDKK